MATLTRQQIEQSIAQADGAALHLDGKDLSALDLSGVDLAGAMMAGADLHRANLH